MTISTNTHSQHPAYLNDSGEYVNQSDFHDLVREGMHKTSSEKVQPQVRGNSPVVSVNAHGTSSILGHVQTNTGDWVTEANDQDILSTARSQTGAPVIGRPLRGDDIIKVRGMECTIDVAQRAGLITMDQQGNYRNGTTPDQMDAQREQAAREAAEKQAKAEADALEALPSESAERALADVVMNTSAGAQTSAMVDLIEHGALRQDTLHRLSSELRVEPHVAQARIENLETAFYDQAAQAAAMEGAVDSEAFYEWASRERPQALKQASYRMLQERTTSGIKDLAKEYIAGLDRWDPEAVLSADLGPGISVFRDSDRRVVVRLPDGRTVGWSSAVRSGLLRVSRAGGGR